MKVKINKILSMGQLYESLKQKILPVQTTYKISKLFTAIEEGSKFYAERLQQLIENYGIKKEDGQYQMMEDGSYEIKPEFINEVNHQQKELLNFEIDLPDITFTLDELEKVELSVEDFNQLLPFIKEQ